MSTVQAAQLTTILDAALNRFAGPLAEPSKRIVHAGGQRWCPALTLACAALGLPPVMSWSSRRPWSFCTAPRWCTTTSSTMLRHVGESRPSTPSKDPRPPSSPVTS